MTRDMPSPPGGVAPASPVAESSAIATVLPGRAVQEGSQSFPRTARLLRADEFATMFRMRPLKRSEHFVIYARPRDVPVPPVADTAAVVSAPVTAVGSDAIPAVVADPLMHAPCNVPDEVAATQVAAAPVANVALGAVCELPGRMGLVLGKKFAARAATRNMMRRALRETFRLQVGRFAGWDVLIRLNLRFDKKRFPGAASPALKRTCRAEIVALLDEAARQIARARRAGTTSAPVSRQASAKQRGAGAPLAEPLAAAPVAIPKKPVP